MRRIDRYIVSSVSASILLVMLVVLSLDLVFAFLAEVEDLKGDYQTVDALLFVLTTVPRRIYDYLPLGAFMGCLIGLGMLAKNSELVVVRAAGVSTGRIVFAAMKPALLVVVVAMLIGEYVVPFTEKIAQSKKAVAQGAQLGFSSSAGLWHREGNVFVHVNAVEPNGILHGVSLQTYDDNRHIKKTVFAKRAIFQRQEWLLEDIRETVFEGGVVSSTQKRVEIWNTALSPSLLSILVVKPDNLSVIGLYKYTRYLQEQNLNASGYLMAFWKKLLQPVSTLVLVFVAISFVFGPLRSATMGYRIFCGLVVGLAFKYMQDLLGPASLVFGYDPIYATLIPISVCAAGGFFLMRRVA